MLIDFISVVFITSIFVLLFLFLWNWVAHVHMTISDSEVKCYGFASYKAFIREFNKVKWDYDENYPRSLFGEEIGFLDYKGYYHAKIIRFRDKGMVINNPLSYFIVQLYVKKYIKENYLELKEKKKIIKW